MMIKNSRVEFSGGLLLNVKISKEGAAMNKVGRNESCPCGSGKKYKHCCLGKEPPQRVVSALNELREAMQGRTFGSLDEVNEVKS